MKNVNEKIQIQFPKSIIFGYDSISELGNEVVKLSDESKKVLVVTDHIVKDLDLFKKARDLLEEEGYEVSIFDEVEPEPNTEVAESVTQMGREMNPDVVVGIGGGSVLDMAKTASILVNNRGKLSDYVNNPIERDGVKKILIPTTAGTGSEVSPYIVFTENHNKKVVNSLKCFANVAIVDPGFTASMPPEVTASTGIDSLSHSIEAMMSIESSPFTDAIAEKAISLISEYLPKAYYDGDDMEARKYMSLAANLSGYSLANAKVVFAHSFSYALGSKYNIPHGVGCGIALPYIMEYNKPMVKDKLASIARAMGVKTDLLDKRKSAEEAIKSVKNLIREIELPLTISEVGGNKEDIPQLAEGLIDRPNNPRNLEKEKAIEIFKRML